MPEMMRSPSAPAVSSVKSDNPAKDAFNYLLNFDLKKELDTKESLAERTYHARYLLVHEIVCVNVILNTLNSNSFLRLN